jgi:hypothetical protein
MKQQKERPKAHFLNRQKVNKIGAESEKKHTDGKILKN